MAILVTVAQVKSDEGAIALGKITGIYLFRGMVKLMSIAFSRVSVQWLTSGRVEPLSKTYRCSALE